jgi:hypothetical protein
MTQVEILDTTTENFDICPTAVEVFEKIKTRVDDLSTRDTRYVIEALTTLDDMLGIEKKVVSKGTVSNAEITEMLALNNNLLFLAGLLSDSIQDLFIEDFEFTTMHIKQVMQPSQDINPSVREEEIKECIVEIKLDHAA